MQLIEKPQHIPSSQTVPQYELGGKQIIITPFQYDVMNYICFEAQRQISLKYGLTKNKQISRDDDLKLEEIKKYQKIETQQDLFNFLRNQDIEINLKELSIFTNKYKSSNTSNMMNEIKKLQDIKVVVNQIKLDSVSNELKSTRFPLISRIDYCKNNTLVLKLEHELIFGWIFEAIPFNRVLIKEQATLSTIYTKHIYALCSEFQKMAETNNGIAWFDVEFEQFKSLLGLKAPNISKLKGNYLNKTIKEINEKTIFNIITCKGKKSKGVNKILFEYTVEERIHELSVEEQIIYAKKEALALARLNIEKEKIKMGIRNPIDNETSWIKKTIVSISDEEVKINDASTAAKLELDEIDIQVYQKPLARKYGEIVGIHNYLLEYIFKDGSDKIITKNAIETLEVLKELDNE